MPIHDWTKVRAGVFHHFHQAWTVQLTRALNKGILPTGYFAMAEQVMDGMIPDVIALERFPMPNGAPVERGGLAVADAPPKTRFKSSVEADTYAEKANRIVIREPLGEVVAVIEIVSPGNKCDDLALESFVKKSGQLIRRGISLLIVDLFPPTRRDPQGIHWAIWEQFCREPFELPSDKPLTVVAYASGIERNAFIEAVAVGDELPSAPIFLSPDRYVPAPLESTYNETWADCPEPVRALMDR